VRSLVGPAGSLDLWEPASMLEIYVVQSTKPTVAKTNTNLFFSLEKNTRADGC
jgi:hypothetical protein